MMWGRGRQSSGTGWPESAHSQWMGAGTSLSLLPDKGTGLSVYPYSLRGEWVGPKLAGGGWAVEGVKECVGRWGQDRISSNERFSLRPEAPGPKRKPSVQR